MMRLWLILGLLLSGWAYSPTTAHAGCVVETTGSYSEGDPIRDDKCDTSGNKKITNATLGAGEAVADDVLKVETRGYYTNITLAAPTTTVIKSGPGWLQTLIINQGAANGTITCYDNTAASGPLIATITQPAALLQSFSAFPYGASFSVGLTCVTATAAQNITVVVR